MNFFIFYVGMNEYLPLCNYNGHKRYKQNNSFNNRSLANQAEFLDLIGFNQLRVFTQVFLILLRVSKKKPRRIGTQKLGFKKREPLLLLSLEAISKSN